MTGRGFSNWVLATSIALLMASAYHLDGPDDHHSEHARAMVLADAQKQAARDVRRDLAAAALCREQHGEAGFAWTEAGALVCLPRKGKRVVHQVSAVGLGVQP